MKSFRLTREPLDENVPAGKGCVILFLTANDLHRPPAPLHQVCRLSTDPVIGGDDNLHSTHFAFISD